MTTLPRITPPNSVVIALEPLTPASFAPFGTAILPPLSQDLNQVPAVIPPAQHERHQPQPQLANQQTALKTSPISPLTNNYPPPDSTAGRDEAKGLMSIFSCFPRQNTYIDQDGKHKLKIEILERHPFTTQTFCPFNFSSSSSSSSITSAHSSPSPSGGSTHGHESPQTYFLVVVAPTLQNEGARPTNPPDLTKLRAFVAPVARDNAPGVAVTYNAGTWHAPMVVLGQQRVDFLVTQFANGRGNDDCQEVLIGSSALDNDKSGDRAVGVEVKLDDLYVTRPEASPAWRAKL